MLCYNMFRLPYTMFGLVQLSIFAKFNLLTPKVL